MKYGLQLYSVRDIAKENVDAMLEGVAKIGYSNKISYINDTIVRALTIRIREKLDNIDIQKFLLREHNFGFIHTKDVYNQIVNFENQNIDWDTYFPNILNVFNKNKEICVIILIY